MEDSSPRRIVLLCGVPGSGKSHYMMQTFQHIAGAVSVSADDFFVGVDGVYRFNPAQLKAAHGTCLLDFIEALEAGRPVVVVNNTNTTAIEMAPYVALAWPYDYDVEIVRILCSDLELAARRNRHGVPLAAIEAMDRRITKTFEEGLPPFWNVKVTTVSADQ